MYKMPVDEIIKRLVSNTDFNEEEIKSKIKAKMDELSGLISSEGAAHIIANELGVKLFQLGTGMLKIKDIVPGMRNVETAGKVTNVFDVREFDTGNRQGKVGNFIIADDTGSIRITLWNEMADKLAQLEKGQIVRIKSAYVRQNNVGFKELHLNDKSALIQNPPGIEIADRITERKQIINLTDEDQVVELMGHVVDMYRPAFFEICPKCSKRIKQDDITGTYTCPEHQQVEPVFAHVLNVLLDDGTGTMRITCWREQAEKLLSNIKDMRSDESLFEPAKANLLGEMLKVVGRVKKNLVSNATELNAISIDSKPKPEEEIEKLEKQVAELEELAIEEEEIE
jgi:replication factor A1